MKQLHAFSAPSRGAIRRAVLLCAALLLAGGTSGLAQDAARNLFEVQARAADEVTLRSGDHVIRLWGVDAIQGGTPQFRLSARTALDDLVGGNKVQCELKSRSATDIEAQCVNADDIDLGLSMLQRGYAVADRAVVYGSAYEEPYISAERQAQRSGAGIWAAEKYNQSGGAQGDLSLLIIIALASLVVLVAAFSGFSFIMLRGFTKMTDAQDRNTEFLSRERQLKNQERRIVATMLDAELRNNKTKIEAYLVIYDEMLKSLRESGERPRYVKTGDIVQMQPALDRSVFDRNTDKMDLLGRRLASAIIHFYARIKTNPDYVNLEPDTPPAEALAHVEKALENARRLDGVLKKVLELFAKSGLGQNASDD